MPEIERSNVQILGMHEGGMKGLMWKWILVVVASLLGTSAMAASEWEEMYKVGGALGKITVRVVDDKGTPVESAHVVAGFFSERKTTSTEGYTDEGGLLVVEGRSTYDVRFKIEKESYYQTSQVYNFVKHATSKTDAIRSGKWMPWNPTLTMTLKKIRNPVPMYAKQVWSVLLACGQPVGFDLDIGDSVAPFGKGLNSDLTFHVVKKTGEYGKEEYNWSCSFSNALDGIQILEMDTWSKFPWSYEAPEDGYDREYAPPKRPEAAMSPTDATKEYYLVFRVRTKTDATGKAISAKYGKMYAEVQVGESERACRVSIGYWFNPDGTRNLEFDPMKNLSSNWRGGDDLIQRP